APVYSAELSVEGVAIPISKEVRQNRIIMPSKCRSCFLRTKEKRIYEIKDVSKDDFIWFISSFHSRNWQFSSVEQAILALSYADRFELLNLNSRVFSYLKKKYLKEDQIKETLILAAKFNRCDDLMLWVLNQCKND
ncbi:hypothetical protein PMAYCL1PPCAC_03624, partial [Pristionchus mayeri]